MTASGVFPCIFGSHISSEIQDWYKHVGNNVTPEGQVTELLVWIIRLEYKMLHLISKYGSLYYNC